MKCTTSCASAASNVLSGNGIRSAVARRKLTPAALNDAHPADRLFAFDERTIGDDRLSVADADRAGSARRSQLVACDPSATRLEVVEPRKALLIRSGIWIGLGLSVHFLGVP